MGVHCVFLKNQYRCFWSKNELIGVVRPFCLQVCQIVPRIGPQTPSITVHPSNYTATSIGRHNVPTHVFKVQMGALWLKETTCKKNHAKTRICHTVMIFRILEA